MASFRVKLLYVLSYLAMLREKLLMNKLIFFILRDFGTPFCEQAHSFDILLKCFVILLHSQSFDGEIFSGQEKA